MRKKEIPLFATTRMNLEGIMLKSNKPGRENKDFMVLFICGI